MKQYFEIVDVMARQICCSDGKPGIEVEISLDDDTVGRASSLQRRCSASG